MKIRPTHQPATSVHGAASRQWNVPVLGAAVQRSVVFSELEDRIARRWYASRRQARDHVRFPRTVLRAVLLHADNPPDSVWANAADAALSALFREWLEDGTSPSQAFARLSELVRCLQSALSQDRVAFGADLGERCESILLDGFAERWWELARSELRAAARF